jgi:PAS domain S-box-containing protein
MLAGESMNKIHALEASAPSRLELEAVAETRNRLAAIVESSDDAILSKDLNGVILSWNSGAEHLFGYKAEEMLGRSVTTLIPEHLQYEEPRILDRIRRGERVEPYETVRRRKDGSLVEISLTVSPVRDSHGRVVGASKIARDITARKRAEQALARRMEEQAALHQFTDRLYRAKSLRDVYEAALDAILRAIGCERASILLFDDLGVMRFVAWRGLSERYRQAVEGHSPWQADASDPDPICVPDVEELDASPALKKTIKAENIRALSFIPLVINGALVGKFMTYYADPHEFSANETELALTIARQLGFSLGRMRTEEARGAAELALRESQRRLQLALTAGRMGAWEWDIDTGKVIWSPNLEDIHGLEPGTFGGNFDDFKRDIHPEDIERVLAKVEESLATRQDYNLIYRIVRPDGEVRALEAFGRLVFDANGNPRKFAGICMDVTERRRTEEQRDLLVAELSHRVKNTLATVVSIAQQSFAKDQTVEEARESFSDRIRALGQTHGRLAEANWSGVSFETLLLDEFAPYRSEATNIKLSGPSIRLSPKQALTLGMAIHELATNAAKYGALSLKGGRVGVVWEVAGDHLAIHWAEAGGPPVKVPRRSGFGRLLLERALAADLKGEVRLDFAPTGLRCDIIVPLDGLHAL